MPATRIAPLSLSSVLSLALVSSCDTATPRSTIDRDVEQLALATVADAPALGPTRAPASDKLSEAKTCGPAGVTAPPADVCPAWRLVGYFPSVDCPAAPNGWTVETLFANAKTPIGRYCRYIWTGDPNAPGFMPKALRSKLQSDCRVFPQSPMSQDLAPAYEQAFAEGTQPIPSQTPLPGGTTVQIAVVDTAPRNTKLGQSEHGPSLAALAAELASGCVPGLGEATCRRKVVTALGLPQTRTGPDATNGGYFGYQSELAEGIVDVLDNFPEANLGDQRLILNLSVGWEARAGEFANPSPAVQAVRDALSIAHCRGALIVAASGNRPPGTCMTQPTGPGSWAHESGLTVAQCQALGLAPADILLPAQPHAYHPFLHAATPVDWSQQNLADFRDGSNAKLAATGFAGFDVRVGERFGPITGSSVSTAVISGIAALVWSYNPTLSADAVMQLLYDSGRSTSRTASLALPQSNMLVGPPQKQVGACAALRHACSNVQSSVCTHAAVAACPGTAPGSVNTANFSAAFDQAVAALSPSDVQTSQGPHWTTLECNGCNGLQRRVSLPPDMTTEPPNHAWVLPQPQKAPCPICKIKQDILYASTDSEYDGYTLLNFSVTLTDQAGVTKVLHYNAAGSGGGTSIGAINSTSVRAIQDSGLLTVNAAGSAPVSAYIHMIFDANGTVITAGNQLRVN